MQYSIGSDPPFEGRKEVFLLGIGEFVYVYGYMYIYNITYVLYTPPTALPTNLACSTIYFLSYDCDSFWRSRFAIMKFRWRCEVGGQPRPLPGLRLVARCGCIYVIMYSYRSVVSRQLPRLITRKIELFLMSIQSSDPSTLSLPASRSSCLVSTGYWNGGSDSLDYYVLLLTLLVSRNLNRQKEARHLTSYSKRQGRIRYTY